MKGHGRHLGQGDLDAQGRYPATATVTSYPPSVSDASRDSNRSWWPGGIGASRRRSRRSGIGLSMCRSTSQTCAARTVRPKPTSALADSARRPTSGTVPRRTLGDRSMTNAERQARYRLAPGRPHDRRSTTGAPPTDAAAPGAGTMPSPNSSSCKAGTRNGSRRCPKTFKRALPARHCKRSSISTSTNLIAVVRPRGFGRD